jgi:asparagine synthase (glutamine-hydrolysing)
MDQCLYADFSTYLPDDLMVKVDIDSMAVSLEGRSPFLDHEFLELTAKIPFNLKLKGLNNKKYILKEALRGLVPDEVMFRSKMGFGIPIDKWFRKELREYAYELLLSEKAVNRKIFKIEEIKKILDEHVNTKISHAYRIWALITLELWFREYFD